MQARLSLPTGADPGDYEGLLAAQIVTEGEGAQVGAAAAAKMTFEVESATLLGAYWHKLSTWFSGQRAVDVGRAGGVRVRAPRLAVPPALRVPAWRSAHEVARARGRRCSPWGRPAPRTPTTSDGSSVPSR